MTILSTLRTTRRSAVAACAVAGAALAALPAYATPMLQGFSLYVEPQGDEQGMSSDKFSGTDKFFAWCLTDKQVRQGLKGQGFIDVDIMSRPDKNRVRVEAAWEDWYYSFEVNRCSGEVDEINRLYKASDGDDDFAF